MTRSRFLLRPLARLVALAFSVSIWPHATADELAVDTSVEARTSIDDNYLFVAGTTPTVLVLALTPRLALSSSTEDSRLEAAVSATSFTVLGQRSDDHTNLNLSLAYEIHDEKEKYNVNVGFVRDLTIETELASTGILLAPLTRNDVTASTGWTHAVTERLSTTLQMSLEEARYSAPFQNADVSNYHYYALPISAAYQVSEQDTLTLALSSSLYHADEVNEHSSSEEMQLAWQHQFDEKGVVSLSAGEFESTTHLRDQITVCPIDIDLCLLGYVPFVKIDNQTSGRSTGSIADLSLQYQLTESDSVLAHAQRDLAPSGIGALVLVESVDATLKHNFDEYSFATLAYARTRSRTLGVVSLFANGFETLSTSYSYKPNQRSTLEIGARRFSTTQDQVGPAIRGYEAYTNFRYDWPQSAAAQAR